jgi:hypothetical protein
MEKQYAKYLRRKQRKPSRLFGIVLAATTVVCGASAAVPEVREKAKEVYQTIIENKQSDANKPVDGTGYSPDYAVTPEPSTMLLLGAGALGVRYWQKRPTRSA